MRRNQESSIHGHVSALMAVLYSGLGDPRVYGKDHKFSFRHVGAMELAGEEGGERGESGD